MLSETKGNGQRLLHTPPSKRDIEADRTTPTQTTMRVTKRNLENPETCEVCQ